MARHRRSQSTAGAPVPSPPSRECFRRPRRLDVHRIARNNDWVAVCRYSRQEHLHNRTAKIAVLRPNSTAVHGDNRAGDGQSKTQAFRLRRHEWLEQAVDELLGNPDAKVLYGETNTFPGA